MTEGQFIPFVVPADADPLEKDIENAVCEYAALIGWSNKKYQSPNERSAPDRIFLKNNRCFWIEFKRKDKKPTKKQYRWLHWLRGMGFFACWTDSVDEGIEIVDRIDNHFFGNKGKK